VVQKLKARDVPAELREDATAIVADLAPRLKSGDVVAILSNGGFGGIYTLLPAALEARGLR
jgi:UDP-N-acetylmuramate: L-alanyl-gamma-D-glutamyl-meso-diaminopimelate ligase